MGDIVAFNIGKRLWTEKGDPKVDQLTKNYLTFTDKTIEEMYTYITRGQSFRAGFYDLQTAKGFGKVNVLGARNLCLDFDQSEWSPQEVVEYAIELGTAPNFWYYSFSQGIKPGNNFRLVWILEELLTKIEFEMAYSQLLSKFEKFSPDPATKDISRLWWGTTKGGEFIRGTVVGLSEIGWLSVLETMEEKGQPLSKIKTRKTNFIPDYAKKLEEAKVAAVNVERGWYEYLSGRCSLWDKWRRGEYLDFSQRIVLWGNLKYLKNNNRSVFDDFWQFYNPKNYHNHPQSNKTEEDYKREYLGVVNSSFFPLPIISNGNTRLTMAQFFELEERGAITINNKEVSLEELDRRMDEEIPRLLETPGITYIKSQTASGKTERVIKWLLSQDLTTKKIIYAAPTYDTIEEFHKRFKTQLAKQFKGWSGITVVPKRNYTQRELLLLEMGVLPKIEKDNRTDAIIKLMSKKREDSSGIFVITHQLLAHLPDLDADLIIVDENIEDALVSVRTIDEAALNELSLGLELDEDVLEVRNFCRNLQDYTRGQEIDISILRGILERFDVKKYIEKTKRAIPGIMKLKNLSKVKIGKSGAKNVLRIVEKSEIINHAIENNTPIKLFTATPISERLNIYYENVKIETYEFPLAENKGKIIQYRGISGARGLNNDKVKVIIDEVKQKLPEEVWRNAYVLSFKGSEDLWEAEGFRIPRIDGHVIHLANNAGLDRFKGENMIIAGKYDYSEDYYLDLYYDALEGDPKNEPRRKRMIEEVGGVQQDLFLWDHEALRRIQKQNIQLAVEQSAGRARALRKEGATVYVFGNFIIRDADEVRE